jgi:hypothetical protein
MIRCYLILFLFTLSHVAHAQAAEDKTAKQISLVAADSLRESLLIKKDSVREASEATAKRLDSLAEKRNLIANRIDAEQQRIASKLDSLKSVKIPDTLLISKYGAFQVKLDRLKAAVATDRMENEIDKKVSTAEDIANSKFDVVNDNVNRLTQGKVNLQNEVDVNNVISIPSLNTPEITVPDANFPSGNVNLPNSTPIDVNVSKPEVPGTMLPNLKVAGFDELERKTQQLSEITGQVKQYREELVKVRDQELDVNRLSDEIEKQFIELDAVRAVEKEIGVNPFTKNWNDPEVMKEMAFNKGKEQALNHFTGHEQELIAAMEQFAKIRSQIKSPEGTMDMLKKRNNPMKELKFTERLVPWLTLQLQKPGSLWFDLNPSLGYRLSGKFTVHAGWNYRLAYANDEGWINEEKIYGPRIALEFTWREFLSFIGIGEVMNSPLKPGGNPSVPEYGERDWIPGFMLGTKTSYSISKTFRGFAQVLYNVFDPEHQSPYGARLNVRIGIEYRFRKKQVEQAK